MFFKKKLDSIFRKKSEQKQPLNVKNPWELSKIHPEKLFISESGYAYDVDQIIYYLKGKNERFETEASGYSAIPGLLKDYENTDISGINTNVFTPKDIEKLMSYPDFVNAIEQEENFQTLQDYTSAIKPDTARMLKQIAVLAKAMEDTKLVYNQDKLGELIGGPIHDLYSYLTEDISKLPESQQKERQLERFALAELTGPKELIPYSMMRNTKNLITDLQGIVTKNSCSAGFNRQIANLSNLIETHKNYAKAVELQHQYTPKNM